MPKWALGSCFALLGLAFAGCYPPLDRYQVAPGSGDAGPGGDFDAGPPLPGQDAGPPTPLDLGTPCGDPHLLLATMGNTSDTARLLRVDTATSGYCRATPVLEQQEGFGFRVRDVDWRPETHDVLGLENAVLGLDTQGFQAWRHQPFDDGSFGASVVVVLNTSSGLRVGAFWSERSSSSYEFGRLVGSTGEVTNERFELPFGAGRMVSAHPAGDGRLLLANLGGPIEVYSVDDSTVELNDADGVELFVGSDMLEDMFGVGNRRWIGADVSTGRIAITHDQGAFLWGNGQGAPTSVFSCPAHCDSLSVGVPGPGNEIYAICDGPTADHLVHMNGSSCTMLIDGTSLGTHDLLDLALVREAR